MLPGLEQRKLRFSCLSNPLSALAGMRTESSTEVINLFPTPFLQFRGELILKSFLCLRHLLPFSFGPFSHLASLSFHVLLGLSHLYLPLLFSVFFFFFCQLCHIVHPYNLHQQLHVSDFCTCQRGIYSTSVRLLQNHITTHSNAKMNV